MHVRFYLAGLSCCVLLVLTMPLNVLAVNADPLAQSPVPVVAPPPPPPQPADTPVGFRARDDGNRVTLEWNDQNEPSKTAYFITVAKKSNGSVQCLKNDTKKHVATAISYLSYITASGFSDWDCENERITPISDTDSTTYTITGLSKSVPYTFSLIAVNAIGNADVVRATGGIDMGGVPPVENLNFTGVSKGIMIYWDAATNAKVTGYDLAITNEITGTPVCFQYDADAQMAFVDSNVIDCDPTPIVAQYLSDTVVSFPVAGLTEFDMYRFTVFATDKAHQRSEPTSKFSLTLESGDRSLLLRWRPSSGVEAGGYTLWSEQNLCVQDDPSNGSGTVTGTNCNQQKISPKNDPENEGAKIYLLKGLANSIRYHLAINDPFIQSAQKSPGPSGAVTKLTAARGDSATSVSANWALPIAAEGNGDPAGYAITIRSNGSPLCFRITPGRGGALDGTTNPACARKKISPARLGNTFFLTYKITGLSPKVSYSVDVYTWNTIGYSAAVSTDLPADAGLKAWGAAVVDYPTKWGEIIARQGLFTKTIDKLWNQNIATEPAFDPLQYPYLGGNGQISLYEVGGHYHCGGNKSICGVSINITAPATQSFKITAPEPGIFTHRARNFNGAIGVSTLRYDPIPPVLVSKQVIAPTDPGVQLTFSDAGLSGVASAEFVLTHESGVVTKQSWVAIGENSGETTIVVPLNKIGKYQIAYDVVDRATNHSKGTFNILAIPGNPYWEAVNTSCATQNKYSCIDFTTDTKIADNADQHTVKMYLRDARGNPVTSIAGIIDVGVNFKFQNTNFLDQIARTGDPVHYRAQDTDLVKTLDQYEGQETGFLTEKAGGNALYTLSIFSFAPTSNGYPRIAKSKFNIKLDTIEIKVVSTHKDFAYSETSTSPTWNHAFPFSPTLTATPSILNFDTVKNEYVASNESGAKIRLGVPKRFGISFKNQSTVRTTATLELGIVADNSTDGIVWSDGAIEKASTTDVNKTFAFDSTDPFSSLWNQLPAEIQSIASGTADSLRLRVNPMRGAAGGGSATPLFDAYVGYVIDGKTVRHAGGSIWVRPEDEVIPTNICGNGVVETPEECDGGKDKDGKVVSCTALCMLDTKMQNIQIIGASGTSQPTQGADNTEQMNQSIGNLDPSEVRAAIAKNIAGFTKNPDVKSKACRGQSYTVERDWGNLPCRFGNGNILYFDHANVTLSDPTGTLVLPEGAKTIIINGGDLYLKSNIVYPGKGNTFGVILVRDDNKNDNPFDDGGNVYIHPSITNLAGAVYAEGTVASVDSSGNAQIADRAKTLNNQLLWEGLLISSNTIGGADRTPAVCPKTLHATCLKIAGGDPLRLKNLASIFDFNYLRLFTSHVGTRAGRNTPTKTNLDGTPNVLLPEPPDGVKNSHPFIIKYDSRIISRPPPLFSITSGANTIQSGR